MGEILAEDCQKKAAEIGFDLTKQFLTLAFAAIAFVVGLSFNTPGTISSLMLWLVIVPFAGSVFVGLVFLMRGVNLLSIQQNYDIYALPLRILAGLQIVLTLIGVVLLVPVLGMHPPRKVVPVANSMEIRISPQQTMIYPLDPDKSISIELEGAKLKITAAKK
jgi:hypothetical protein